jgi:hypothetical protein
MAVARLGKAFLRPVSMLMIHVLMFQVDLSPSASVVVSASFGLPIK